MQVLRLPALESKVGMKHTAIYKKIGEGGFPKPIQLGPRAVGWLEHEVDAWLEAQATRRAPNIRRSGGTNWRGESLQ